MKRSWPCLVAVLVLSSCISVDDFGAYWDKGFVDPALEGTWEKVDPPGEDIKHIPGPRTWRFTRNGSSYAAYAIHAIDPTDDPEIIAQKRAVNDRYLNARSLRIGKHLFLMQRDPGGQPPGLIQRYEIQGTTLREYWIDNDAALNLLNAKHPAAKNIRKNPTSEGEFVVIGTFDDEVFQVLSEMVDNPTYWRLNCEYKKGPDAGRVEE